MRISNVNLVIGDLFSFGRRDEIRECTRSSIQPSGYLDDLHGRLGVSAIVSYIVYSSFAGLALVRILRREMNFCRYNLR